MDNDYEDDDGMGSDIEPGDNAAQDGPPTEFPDAAEIAKFFGQEEEDEEVSDGEEPEGDLKDQIEDLEDDEEEGDEDDRQFIRDENEDGGEGEEGEGDEEDGDDEEGEGESEEGPRLFTLKVNGRTEQLTEEALVARAQKAENAEAVTQESRERERRATAIIDEINRDPISTIYDILSQEKGAAEAHRIWTEAALATVKEEMRVRDLPPAEQAKIHEERLKKDFDRRQQRLEEERAQIEKERQEASQREVQAEGERVVRAMQATMERAGLKAEENLEILKMCAFAYDDSVERGVPTTPESVVVSVLKKLKVQPRRKPLNGKTDAKQRIREAKERRSTPRKEPKAPRKPRRSEPTYYESFEDAARASGIEVP